MHNEIVVTRFSSVLQHVIYLRIYRLGVFHDILAPYKNQKIPLMLPRLRNFITFSVKVDYDLIFGLLCNWSGVSRLFGHSTRVDYLTVYLWPVFFGPRGIPPSRPYLSFFHQELIVSFMYRLLGSFVLETISNLRIWNTFLFLPCTYKGYFLFLPKL